MDRAAWIDAFVMHMSKLGLRVAWGAHADGRGGPRTIVTMTP